MALLMKLYESYFSTPHLFIWPRVQQVYTKPTAYVLQMVGRVHSTIVTININKRASVQLRV